MSQYVRLHQSHRRTVDARGARRHSAGHCETVDRDGRPEGAHARLD